LKEIINEYETGGNKKVRLFVVDGRAFSKIQHERIFYLTALLGISEKAFIKLPQNAGTACVTANLIGSLIASPPEFDRI
jgi:hypothetical protein